MVQLFISLFLCHTGFPLRSVLLAAARWSLVCLAVCWLHLTPALALDPAKAITQYGHDVWQDGLPQTSVLAIAQTRDGYLWLGTHEGLVRFNGQTFTVFDKRNTPEITSNSIWTLFEDHTGALWCGTLSGGLVRYQAGRFTRFTTAEGLGSNFVYAVAEDRNGALWVGTSSGLCRWQDGTWTTLTTRNGLSSNNIRALFCDSQGILWIGTHDGGLNRLHDGQIHSYTTTDGLPGLAVYSIAEDASHRIWFGVYGNGLGCFDQGGLRFFTTHDGLSSLLVWTIFFDRLGTLWIGTEGGGLNRYRNGVFSVYSTKDGLSQEYPRSFWEDREGSLWVGTSNGLNRFKDGKFTAYTVREGLSSNNTRVVMEDSQGRVWIGTEGGGVNCLVQGKVITYTTANGLSNNLVKSIFEDRQGNLWFGTTGGGLDRLANGKWTNFSTAQGLSNGIVYALCQDLEGTLWVGTYGGGLFAFRNNTFISYRNEVNTGYIRSLFCDRAGTVWIGTDDKGLVAYNKGGFHSYTTKEGLSNDVVFAIHQDPDDVLWVGTNSGLNRFQGGKFTVLTARDGLFDDKVFCILRDRQDNFWMSCNKGIYTVSRQTLNRFALREINGFQVIPYNKADGMPSNQCNGASQPAGWQGRDGKLWFPTAGGAVSIDPEFISHNPVPPPVVIEQFLVDQKPVAFSNFFEIAPGAENFEIHYAGLSFFVPERVRFKYRLEGFDKDWVDAGNRRTAFYTNLAPGTYRFLVMACNNDNVWSTAEVQVAFELRPFFYKTPWAYLFYFGLTIGIGTFLVRLRLQQLHKQNAELEAIVQKRTAALAESVEALKVSEQQALDANRAKSVFLATMSHELRTPLNAILGFVQLMERERTRTTEDRKNLRIITQSGEHLLSLINDVLSISKIEAGQVSLNTLDFDLRRLLEGIEQMFSMRADAKRLQFVCQLDPAVPQFVHGDEGKIRQILINLLGNAFKFTEKGSVTLTVTWKNFRIGFVVEDTGPGIAPHELPKLFQPFKQTHTGQRAREGTGLGLAISRSFVQLLGGEISVTSKVGHGTRFSFEIPLTVVSQGEQRSIPRRVVGLEPDQPTFRLLVVDDKFENRELLSKLLTPLGFALAEATNGQEAVACAAAWKPDLIWMDMRMPVMDGFEATQAIRSLGSLGSLGSLESPKDRKPKVRNQKQKIRNPELETGAVIDSQDSQDWDPVIIALTASVFEHERGTVFEAGCDDFVAKPFQVETIFEKLALHLGVRFQYQTDEEPELLVYPAHVTATATETAAVIPEQLLQTLNAATVEGDIVAIRLALDELTRLHPQLAQELQLLAQRYQFEELQERLSQYC
ncbi:MAG: response regulator [Blastocatellia bacterium]|nr:response regulator [Blastocatellia bacterium]